MDNFSLLYKLVLANEKCKQAGKFEFMLYWPKREGPNYNWWKQSTNPLTYDLKVNGYSPVDVRFTNENFYGLESGHMLTTIGIGRDKPRMRWKGALMGGAKPPGEEYNNLHKWNYAVGSAHLSKSWTYPEKEGGFVGPDNNLEKVVEFYVMCPEALKAIP